MEVVGVVASSLHLITQCVQITKTIDRWIESVKTVDNRIEAFVFEVGTLRATYESLNLSLKEPSMLEAARNTNRDAGGHLWTHMSRILRDCERTMNGIINVLEKIQDSSRSFFSRSVVKQLKESLNSDELSRLREQVVIFNSSLQLPMQMITLTVQLRQQETTTTHQLQLNDQLSTLRRSIERISKGLPQRQVGLGGSTLLSDSPADIGWFNNIENYVEDAKKFLDSASGAASTLSARSVSHADDNEEHHAANQYRRNSDFVPLTIEKLQSISMHVEQVPAESTSGTASPSDIQSVHMPSQAFPDDSDNDNDDDTDLSLLQSLLRNGNKKLDSGDYAAAEENYREALGKSRSNNFDSRTACSTVDICLMLGGCIVQQQKYDEAISLLQPLANLKSARNDTPQSSSAPAVSFGQRNPDRGQALSANHLLGEVYLKKSDYLNAEKYAEQAYRGRKELLGKAHQKTIESVQLVIEMYKAKGRVALADAYGELIDPVQPASLPGAQSSSSTASTLDPTSPTTEPTTIPVDTTLRPRQPTSNIPFRQQRRAERAPTLYAGMSRTEMEEKFKKIASLSNDGRTRRAVDEGITFLKRYDPRGAIFIHREDELKKNIKKSRSKGLAGSGYGFSALHFFCSLEFEPTMEVDILLELEADVNAVAYKAGYDRVEPFTPLYLAVKRGHCNLVRLLLTGGSRYQQSSSRTGTRYDSEQDTVHPLIQACTKGNVGVMQIMLEHGMTVAEHRFPLGVHGNSLLHEACYRCDLGMVEYLMSFARRNNILESGGQTSIGRPGQQDRFGLTPIMYAVDMRDHTDPELVSHKLQNRIACLKLLLENNDIPLQETDNGEIVVDHPRGNSPGRLAVDLNVRDRHGNTVYWYANQANGGDSLLLSFLNEQSHRSQLIQF
ncbi:E3 ubiquitin-protein ligase mib1 [Lithohypha guttulata]|uniref:E3 ubiquitin-protein ligase mib1 n=1 Tax=Lithohypha guttulata TaxID=1690604 RepID=A0AAN7T0G1_9EURO|nr:E3 ubiquitin-protein ligase mib1 [Lithohypha guttulata]